MTGGLRLIKNDYPPQIFQQRLLPPPPTHKSPIPLSEILKAPLIHIIVNIVGGGEKTNHNIRESQHQVQVPNCQ